jgi:hypothetical protein
MKARSAKDKGNRFEYYLRDRLQADVDHNTRKNMMSGAGYDKGDLRIPSHDIVVEAKNHANVRLIDWWEQAKVQALGGDTPILAIRNPKQAEFKETLIVMDLEYFISLLVGQSDEVEVTTKLDYSQRRNLDTLITAAKQTLKDFERL